MIVKIGDTIKVDYVGSFEDGTIFDASQKGAPLEFKVGAGEMIKGFDDAVKTMSVGEEKEITILPQDAYGLIEERLIQKVPKKHLPQTQEPKIGMAIMVHLPTGQKIPARIVEIDDEQVTFDLNHPLAGKTLKFKIKVVEVVS